MKTIGKITLLSICLSGLLVSCVSTKKYEEAMAWQDKYKQLETEYVGALSEKDKLQAQSNEELAKKEAALKEQEAALAAREAKMEELNGMIEQQKNAVLALKQEVCSALKCFTPEELQVNVRDGRLYVSLSDKLLFESGSDAINERGLEAVKMLATVLNNSDLQIMIEGHTDNVPIKTRVYKDNWDLSVHRATTVVREMVDAGIDPERVIASGRGEFSPIAENDSKDGKQLNRRTEIVLAPKLDKLWKLTETGEMAQEL